MDGQHVICFTVSSFCTSLNPIYGLNQTILKSRWLQRSALEVLEVENSVSLLPYINSFFPEKKVFESKSKA